MRPKKRILLIDDNGDRQAVTRFVLQCWAFHIISAHDLIQVELDESKTERLDAVLAFGCYRDLRLAEIAAASNVQSISVLTSDEPSDNYATHVLRKPTMATLIDLIKTASARKRGPKKGVKYPPKKQPGTVAWEVAA